MFAFPSAEAKTASTLKQTFRRICGGIAFVGAVALWLWALPALLPRDGFGPRNGEPCRQAYRDPVTGRLFAAPGVRVVAPDACRTAAGDRP